MKTASQEVVTPVKTGVQVFPKPLEMLDSGYHRNDGKGLFMALSKKKAIHFKKLNDYRKQAEIDEEN
jgi:hypothetical protein